MYVQIKKGGKVQNMKKLYEYVISSHLGFNFIKRISINENTKTVWFELIVIDTKTNEEEWLIKDTNDLSTEQTSWKIKDFLLGIIEVEITNENIYNKTIEQLDNGFKVNGKTFLLEDNNYAELRYAELREKVLNEVKQYELH